MATTLDDLQSCTAKLTRATKHADTLYGEIRAWRNRQPVTLARQRNPEGTRHSLVARIREEPDILRWSLIAADCVHNARTVLDHLVYAIATYEAEGTRPAAFRQLVFPIEDSANGFKDRLWRIKSLSKPVIDAIESVQPYRRHTEPDIPPLLTILRFLDNVDKHRLLHLPYFQQEHGEPINLKVEAKQTIHVGIHLGEVIDGTEVFDVTLPDPDPNYRLNFLARLAVTIPHRQGPPRTSRSNVIDLLAALLEEVRQVAVLVRDSARS